MDIKKITEEKGHYLVGFHDIDPWSSNSNTFLCLKVESMEEIPNANTYAEIVLVDLESGKVSPLDRTICWNFPQGGRQAWIKKGSTDRIIFNVLYENRFVAKIIDTEGSLVRFCDKPTYCISPCQEFSYGLNYERMYRLGGYGYAGVMDKTAGIHTPEEDGIWKTDLATGNSELILSLKEIAHTKGNGPILFETDHYVTHILPSPDGSKICFLHRYWLPDGGIQTRLVICDNDGTGSEVWDEGFLSHFDWIDNESIMIWGKPITKAQALRSSSFLQKAPIIPALLQLVKPVVRKLLGKKIIAQGFYKIVTTREKFSNEKFSEELPIQDGHPSFCPKNRSLLLTDTYPNEDWVRQLMVFDCKENKLHVFGELKQSDKKPSAVNYESVLPYIDKDVMKKFSMDNFVYSRSGIHCDFHPRWKSDCGYFAIDSNHEGYRSVYIVKLPEELNQCMLTH